MSADLDQRPAAAPGGPPSPRASELGPVELLRYGWRQLTSMRTALVLLLLLALAAIPGSVIPQRGVDSIATSRWQDDHPDLTPVFERLGLFSVYDAPWFASIYLLLVTSLVGCIVPRTAVYFRGMRALPPVAPRRLSRMPGHASYDVAEPPKTVLDRAETVLRKRGYRVRRSAAAAGTDGGGAEEAGADDGGAADGGAWVSAERGYLREAGNLLFHLSVLVVLVGFAMGSLFGYTGGAIVLVGGGFSNTATQYDELDPGSLFDVEDFSPPFSFTIDDFDIEWLLDGPSRGQARGFVSHLTYQEDRDAEPEQYDLKVNHPLDIGGTEVFLIGHGYAPVITVRDGNGDIAYRQPTIFLPRNPTFQSFGVVKAPDALPEQIGLMGELYPTYAFDMERGPYSTFGDAWLPAMSLTVWTGDLGMDEGTGQSVYLLDTDRAEPLLGDDGRQVRLDLEPGETAQLPDGLGSVTFEGLERWNKVQISRTPGKLVALAGVLLALLGLLGSLFVRPRRVWVRARAAGPGRLGPTHVEVAGLDRSGNADLPREVALVAAAMGLREPPAGNDAGNDAGDEAGTDEEGDER